MSILRIDRTDTDVADLLAVPREKANVVLDWYDDRGAYAGHVWISEEVAEHLLRRDEATWVWPSGPAATYHPHDC